MGRKCYVLRTTNSAGKVVFEDFELLEDVIDKMRRNLIDSSCFNPSMHESLDIVIKKTFFQ